MNREYIRGEWVKIIRLRWFFPSLLCSAVMACYANSLANGFVSDDTFLIVLNRDTPDFHGLITSFTTCDYFIVSGAQPYYRPLAKLIYMIEHSLFGLRSLPYHAGNIALHAVATILLYRTLLALECRRVPSFAAALLFAVHPVNAEPVDMIVAMNNILAAIFVLGSLLVFLSPPNGRRSLLSGFLFFMGLLSKETAVMLVPILFWLGTLRHVDFRKPRAFLQSDVSCIVPHLGFLLVYLVLRMIALEPGAGIAGLAHRLWGIVYIIPKYLALIAFPMGISFGYPIPLTYSGWVFFGWGGILTLGVYLYRTRTPAVSFGAIWLFLNFLPISTIIPLPSGPMADRFLYMPLIGLAVIVADRLGGIEREAARRVAGICTVSLFIFFSALTVLRNRDWKDSLAFAEALVRTDGAADSYYYAGYERLLRGERSKAKQAMERSIELDSRHAEASWAGYYLSVLSLMEGDVAAARRHLSGAELADNGKPAPHYLLGYIFGLDAATRDAAAREDNLFLWSAMPSSSHLIPEVADRENGTEAAVVGSVLAEPVHLQENWKLYHRFTSGTVLYFDRSGVRRDGDTTKVSVRHLLGKKDRLRYALKFIKYPLDTAAEVRYDFEMKCPQRLYKTTWCEFRDRDGKLLGQSDTEREDWVRYWYPLPGTPMDSLFEHVCRSD